MSVFKETKFDANAEADAACQQLFTKSSKQNQKNKRGKKTLLAGRILKKQKVKFTKFQKDILKTELLVSPKSESLFNKTKDKLEEKSKKKTKLQTNPNESNNNNKKQTNTNKKKNKKKSKSFQEENSTGNVDEEQLKNEIQNILNGGLFEDAELPLITKKKTEKPKENTKLISIKTIQNSTLKRKKPKTKKFQKVNESDTVSLIDEKDDELPVRKSKKIKQKDRLREILIAKDQDEAYIKPPKMRNLPLRERMLEKLKAARFRYLNEQIYSSHSQEAQQIFNTDPEAFHAYHEGYRQQVNKWPLNPLDTIIKSIQKMPKSHIIADFGCGEGKLAKSVNQKVHSFDLVAANDSITACDMAHVPLKNSSVDVVVFCLSLMGTNLHDYLLEANRVLKSGGALKIAEVESRFDDVKQFIEGAKRFNFKLTWNDLSHNLFYFLDFEKESNIKNAKKLPTISLHPCLYKKR